MIDVRDQLRELFLKTKATLNNERNDMLVAVKLIGDLHDCNPWVNLDMDETTFLQKLGIGRDAYYSRVRAAKAFCSYPEIEQAFLAGELELTTISRIEAKLSRDNIEIVLENIRGKSKREAALFMNTVTAAGEILDRPGKVELTITVSEEELAAFERLKEVLSSKGHNPKYAEVLTQAVEDSLEKRDPLRKARRAEARRNKNLHKKVEHCVAEKKGGAPTPVQVRVVPGQQTPALDQPFAVRVALGQQTPALDQPFAGRVVPGQQTSALDQPFAARVVPGQQTLPASVRHQVWLRDQGQCTHEFIGGGRCNERAHLEIDHKLMRCHGGGNELENLRLLCRRHNQNYAEIKLGKSFMEDCRMRQKNCSKSS